LINEYLESSNLDQEDKEAILRADDKTLVTAVAKTHVLRLAMQVQAKWIGQSVSHIISNAITEVLGATHKTLKSAVAENETLFGEMVTKFDSEIGRLAKELEVLNTKKGQDVEKKKQLAAEKRSLNKGAVVFLCCAALNGVF
jgi:hypothetical protein